MTAGVEFVVFSLAPGAALVLGIGYTFVSTWYLDDYRPLVLVALLGLMALHQSTEVVRYSRGVLQLDPSGELAETGANLLASLTSYFLLGFLREQQRMSDRVRTQARNLRVLDRVLRHNFHNDMNVIKGYAETILSSSEGDTDRFAGIIVDQCERLLHTVDKEHEITTRLSNPRSPEPIELPPLIESVASSVDRDGRETNVSVRQPVDVVVEATEDLGLAIDELVTNAIDHSDRDTPTVAIDVTVHEDTAMISVADDGPGIPEMERHVLTVERDIDPLYHGSGVGLWLVSLIVSQSNGKLSFHENDPRGSVVTIHLQTV